MEVDEILHRSEEKMLMLCITTDWSGASHIQSIYADQLSEEFAPQIEQVKIDFKSTAAQKLDYFGVNSAPSTLLIKKKKIIGFWEGLTAKDKMRKVISSHLD